MRHDTLEDWSLVHWDEIGVCLDQFIILDHLELGRAPAWVSYTSCAHAQVKPDSATIHAFSKLGINR
jgi:hypothetical protein